MGYQLFSIRDRMATDPVQTLKELKAMGYEDFELYGYDPIEDTIYGMRPPELKTVLDDLGLTVTSGHYWFADLVSGQETDLERLTDRYIAAAKTLGNRYITWPVIGQDLQTTANFERLPDLLNPIAERVTAAGLGFAYHNHGYEFADYGGRSGYDRILQDTDADKVKLQLDMYWVMHAAKTTPRQIVADNPGRVVMWHIKDMDAVTRDYTELGNGTINYQNVLPDPTESGLEYAYIEQGGNFTKDSLESARASANYYQLELAGML